MIISAAWYNLYDSITERLAAFACDLLSEVIASLLKENREPP